MSYPTSKLERRARALAEGRVLRSADGRIIRNDVNSTGVIIGREGSK